MTDSKAKDFLWWRDGVIYQIYPRSFMDSNADGLGDLNGITARLDYLQDLGIDAIWLSPVNPSPDVDFGYDVSDYCDIDPKFGTLADFDRLIAEANRRGIRIVMDLVLNHTSDQHAWFRQARASRENPYHDWYIWSDPDEHGRPPNNWQSVFGGRAWQWDENLRQYYYHMFYKEQPDLNWRNPAVRAAMLDVFRFWAERGVQGFRLDVFNVYFKDALLRSNPVNRPGLRPFDWQTHRYDFDQPELIGVLEDIRKLLDAYPDCYAVGETFCGTPERAAGYCGEGLLHAAFNFNLLESRWSARRYAACLRGWEHALGAGRWPTQVLNNHDTVRSATRFGQGEDDERMKAAAALLLTLRGTPFMYYGEEIGMRDIRVSRSQILDPIGRRYWPFFKGRDGCRAPMQWDASAAAGFSPAQTWLPVHPDYRERNVAAQSAQPDSLLNTYRQLLALRRANPVLVRGDLDLLDGLPRDVLAYRRTFKGSQALVLLNMGTAPAKIDLPAAEKLRRLLWSSHPHTGEALNGDGLTLAGNQALILAD